MAKNLRFEEEDIDLFEKLSRSNKPKFNSNNDSKEKIKQKRRERDKMRQQLSKNAENYIEEEEY